MIYDRPYMKSASDNTYQQKSIVFILLVINVGLFVLQNVLHILLPDTRIIENLFVLNPSNLPRGKSMDTPYLLVSPQLSRAIPYLCQHDRAIFHRPGDRTYHWS
jgi:hypothetical protein